MDDSSIWSAYERTCLYYSKCKDLTNCSNCHDNNCYCHEYALFRPTLIGDCGFSDENIKPNINKKCYIGFGELCSICVEPIITKTSAWLTPCGHSFHRKCLIENYQYRSINRMTIDHSNQIPCPVCREGHVGCCVGLYALDKYHSKNGLDKLENFWLKIDVAPYLFCYKCRKGLGMSKQCNYCDHYRNTGKFY